jgi:hypothetical protein
MIDAGQVEAIISETRISTIENVAELRRNLEWARTWYVTRKKLATDLPKRKAKVVEIEKAARKLSSLLADEDAWGEISWATANVHLDPRIVLKLIVMAAEDYNTPDEEPAWAAEAAKRMTAELGINTLSAFDWLVGVHLATIYERHFGQPAGRSRMDDGQVGGPYVRFVQATLRELGILNRGNPYRPETIARALFTARAHGED